MTIISPTEFRAEQKKYLDLAEHEKVIIKRGKKLIHLVVEDRKITEADLAQGITAEELIKRVHKRIDSFKDKK